MNEDCTQPTGGVADSGEGQLQDRLIDAGTGVGVPDMPTPVRYLILDDEEPRGRQLAEALSMGMETAVWDPLQETGRRVRERCRAVSAIVLRTIAGETPWWEWLPPKRPGDPFVCPVMVLADDYSSAVCAATLDAGADDCRHPSTPVRELQARLTAIVRSSRPSGAVLLRAGGLALDVLARRAWLAGRDLNLSSIEFCLLELLMRYSGHVVSRGAIATRVWGNRWSGSNNVIEWQVMQLRKKCAVPGEQQSIIRTVRGRGYCILVPVSTESFAKPGAQAPPLPESAPAPGE